MSDMWTYLHYSFAQHALIAATLVALVSGLIAPFVAARDMAFAVHGSAELAFPTAVAGLLIANDALTGALVGSVVVAVLIAVLGTRGEGNTAIGVLLAFGLGLGVFLLSLYHGYASQATNILFGSIVSVTQRDLLVLAAVAGVVSLLVLVIYRPLLFSSIDPDVAEARGVPTRLLGLLFVLMLTVTVTEVAQVVGTLLVLSLAITPAAAARRWTAAPLLVSALSVLFALLAADGGFLLSLAFIDSGVKASVFITFISFGLYVVARAAALVRRT
jgi:zinc/manganese transport system permease protein